MQLATIILLTLSAFNAFSQLAGNPMTKAQALEDLKILEVSLNEIHPDIYRYTSRADFEKELKNVREQLDEVITVKQFYNLIAPIITMVRCGHTFGIVSLVDDQRGLLPLDVKILNDKLFFLRDLSRNSELPNGSEILSINEMSATDLINDLRNKQNADGYGINFKDRIIERDFRWKFATFINQPDSFRIEFRDHNTKEQKRLTIAALSANSIAEGLRELNRTSPTLLSFSIDKKNDVAILKLGSFMTRSIKRQSGQNLKKTIKESFRKLHDSNLDNLILDLRGNTGGKVFATPLLFSYLADQDFKVARKIVFKHGYKFRYPEYLNRSKFNDWVNKKLDRKVNDSTYEWTLHKITRKTFKPKQNRFRGNLYVITNGSTASAGAEMASILRAHNKGTFVGEETGGDFNGVNGFDRTYVRLPNSGIGVLIAGWRSIMTWENERNVGHGVIPDYPVTPSIEDMLSGIDTEMEFTNELIRKTK